MLNLFGKRKGRDRIAKGGAVKRESQKLHLRSFLKLSCFIELFFKN